MRLAIPREPFDDPEYLHELKYDGFRALPVIRGGRAQLSSRNGNLLKSYAPLCRELADTFVDREVLLDGEIVVLDGEGRPQCCDLLRRRGEPCFVAFDLLAVDGRDLRRPPLEERKAELARVVPTGGRVLAAGHVAAGEALFRVVCQCDLEGIVAKWRRGEYVAGREASTWFKVRNPAYSQREGRPELLQRTRAGR